VILQVGSFKLRGKRIFRNGADSTTISNLLGWSESKVIVRFLDLRRGGLRCSR